MKKFAVVKKAKKGFSLASEKYNSFVSNLKHKAVMAIIESGENKSE